MREEARAILTPSHLRRLLLRALFLDYEGATRVPRHHAHYKSWSFVGCSLLSYKGAGDNIAVRWFLDALVVVDKRFRFGRRRVDHHGVAAARRPLGVARVIKCRRRLE